MFKRKSTKSKCKSEEPKSYSCMCKSCGWRDNADLLVYDFTEIIKENWNRKIQSGDGKKYSISKNDIENLIDACLPPSNINECRTMKGFPFLFTQDEIIKNFVFSNNFEKGKTGEVILSIPAEKLLKNIESFREKNEVILKNSLLEGNDRMTKFEAIEKFEKAIKSEKNAKESTSGKSTENPLDFYIVVKLSWIGRTPIMIIDNAKSGKKINRCCPVCGKPMNIHAGEYPEITMTVIGASHVSKTTTVAAALNSLDSLSGNKLWVSDDINVNTEWRDFRENYIKPYSEGEKVTSTDIAFNDIPRFSVELTYRGFNTVLRKFIISFIDLPGEFWASNKSHTKDTNSEIDEERDIQDSNTVQLNKYNEIFDNIDFIWCCIDAAMIADNVRTNNDNGNIPTVNELKKKAGYDDKVAIPDFDEMNGRLVTLNSYLMRSKKPKCGITILGKIDILPEEFNEYKRYKENHNREMLIDKKGNFIAGNFKVKSYNIKLKLTKYHDNNVDGFINTFEDVFRGCNAYTVTTNYGFAPEDDHEERILEPYNTEVPLLWMLACAGIIPVKLGGGESILATDEKSKLKVWNALKGR